VNNVRVAVAGAVSPADCLLFLFLHLQAEQLSGMDCRHFCLLLMLSYAVAVLLLAAGPAGATS